MTSSAEVNAWINEVIERFGRLDGAANMAGIIGPAGKVIEVLGDEEFEGVLDVNLKGIFYCLRAQLRVMGMGEGAEGAEGGGEGGAEGAERKAVGGGGSIVNAASVAGLAGSPGLAPYVVSKVCASNLAVFFLVGSK